ncbi:DNA-binding transcriptional regulator, AcrR family [Asanoa hainanensis]|uniref:DNA-binding transcriptional regulator, AcrR family n=1 Tax=Asanoa hainanensis TaxID=560556 RepID=A0A239NV13_9ACTN|nr:TetR family transcriptional regulator [Asanoa hainanensis]SNT58174.1 DNA-binding transcriptional regulator, AcrR family [Asanoa hainanensis]
MPAEQEVGLGLRERKKLRTRATIREQAMRLFAEKGYGETTVEQIAEAAEISPSTFFRYFPSKEQLVLVDDLDPIMIRSFQEQPADLPVLTALRRSMERAFTDMSPEQFDREQARQKLIRSVPELRAAQLDELQRTIKMLADGVAERLGRPAGDIESRAFAGAVVGTILGVLDDEHVFSLDRMGRALDLFEAGFPFDKS